MARKRITTKEFSPQERNAWKNLEVNLDSFSNRWEELHQKQFIKEIDGLTRNFLKKVLDFHKIDYSNAISLESKLAENRKAAILFYCIIIFAHKSPKVISEIFKIDYFKRKPNYPQIYEKVFDAYAAGRLSDLFLFLLKRQLGGGRQYNFLDTFKDKDFEKISKFMPRLAIRLKRKEKTNKIYHYRFGYKGKNNEWLFLLLKEASDKVYLAIPNNISMVRGIYKLISITPSEKRIEINTTSKDEAVVIRNFFNNRLRNPNTFRREETSYDPKVFFKEILTERSDGKLALVELKLKGDNTALRTSFQDKELKNDIVARLKVLKNNHSIKLEDFSEFESISFKYKGLIIKIRIFETTWGTHQLHLVDRRLTPSDIESFKKEFYSKFKIRLGKWLKRSDNALNRNFLISKILDRKTVPVNIIVNDVEEALFQLMNDRIISKMQHQAKRICENSTCRTKTWDKHICPRCGSNLRIDGDFVSIDTDTKGIYDFIYKSIKAIPELKTTRDTIQITRKKFSIIEVVNSEGDNLTVFIASTDVPDEIINHYHSNAIPLLVILSRYKEAIYHRVVEKNFECIGLVDFYSNSQMKGWVLNTMNKFITGQKVKWKEKLLEKGLNSYNSLIEKGASYSSQQFETDIYNLFHELFYIAYKLGGSFTGVKAPDGIVSIKSYLNATQKLCMAWDCKYSTRIEGYKLNEPARKHRHYIKVLDKNSRVRFYGGLKVHAIISQKMDMKSYKSFYTKLVSKFSWKGNVIFIHESILLKLYAFFRYNSLAILSKPQIFYASAYRLFLKIHKADQNPYPVISESRMEKFYLELNEKYSKLNIKLEFNRSDFS